MRDSKKRDGAKDYKSEQARHSKFHTPRLAKRIIWPKPYIQLAWKELHQLLFSQTFGRLSRDAPAKILLCDAERMLKKKKKKETKNRRLPPLFGKLDETRKSGNSCKKDCVSTNYGLKVQ